MHADKYSIWHRLATMKGQCAPYLERRTSYGSGQEHATGGPNELLQDSLASIAAQPNWGFKEYCSSSQGFHEPEHR